MSIAPPANLNLRLRRLAADAKSNQRLDIFTGEITSRETGAEGHELRTVNMYVSRAYKTKATNSRTGNVTNSELTATKPLISSSIRATFDCTRIEGRLSGVAVLDHGMWCVTIIGGDHPDREKLMQLLLLRLIGQKRELLRASGSFIKEIRLTKVKEETEEP